mmetsp:Transcript_34794/g.99971  ORF Transcript_34794/g.99971 Transcript_34794/m.99971 type:complete len:211 (+) Transcript_34794:900-1532(+)
MAPPLAAPMSWFWSAGASSTTRRDQRQNAPPSRPEVVQLPWASQQTRSRSLSLLPRHLPPPRPAQHLEPWHPAPLGRRSPRQRPPPLPPPRPPRRRPRTPSASPTRPSSWPRASSTTPGAPRSRPPPTPRATAPPRHHPAVVHPRHRLSPPLPDPEDPRPAQALHQDDPDDHFCRSPSLFLDASHMKLASPHLQVLVEVKNPCPPRGSSP